MLPVLSNFCQAAHCQEQITFFGNTFYIGTAATGGLTNIAQSNQAWAECASMTNTSGANSFTFEVMAPFDAEYTRVKFHSADIVYWRIGATVHNLATSYDGMRLSALGGTMTGGTIAVYGYRKA